MKKTLLVGLDAACWDYLNPLLAAGRLPILQQLMGRGVSGVLHTTFPPLTPVAWSSIITGKNPGKHAVFDMTWRIPGTYDFVPASAHTRQGSPFWKYLNAQGIRVGLVNVPFTYPPDALDGFWIGGFGTPQSVPDIIYPSELRGWLEAKYGSYEPTVSAGLLQDASPEHIFAAERSHQATQVDIAIDLLAREPVDVLVINLMLLDHANHKMPDMHLVEEAMCATDVDLGKLMAQFQPDHVMVISDHGARRVEGDFLLHAWLRDQKYTVQAPRTQTEKRAALNWILVQWLQRKHKYSGASELALRHMIRALLPTLTAKMQHHFWQMIERSIPFAREHYLLSNEIDYAQTTAFLGVSYSGVIYLNIAGREPNGLIMADEQSRVVERIAEELLRIQDPDSGSSLFSNVYLPGTIYSGPATGYAPDLIIDGYDARWNVLGAFDRGAIPETVQNRYFVANRKDFGHHSRNGIFVFAGEGFPASGKGKANHVMDIPATLLYLYDVPIPDDYDGTVLVDLLSTEFRQEHPVRVQPGDRITSVSHENTYSVEESAVLLDHLRALGYVQ